MKNNERKSSPLRFDEQSLASKGYVRFSTGGWHKPAAKAIRDELADWLGVDDGDHRVLWEVDQVLTRGTPGVRYSTLRRAKKNGAPGFHASGRMEFRPVLEWIFKDGEDDSTESYDDQWKKVRAERERFKLEMLKGQYYDSDKFDEAITRTFARFMSEIARRFTAVAPGESAHKGAVDIRRINEGHLSAFAKWAQDEAEKLAKCNL